MAGVAVHAVVYVTVDTAVFRIGCAGSVTSCAGEDGVVGRVGVASCANSICVPVIKGEERVIAVR